jgi:DNA-binding transcriptional regulator LsrR (DeoR family)
LLASVERNGVPAANPLEIGIGSPAGTDCGVTMSANVPASLIPQLRHEAAVGTYCVRVADTEGLSAPTTFTIRVIHP